MFDEMASVTVYPNPSEGMVFIENTLNESQEITLMDMNGRVLRRMNLQPITKVQLNLGHLVPGVYLINSGNQTHRLILTH